MYALGGGTVDSDVVGRVLVDLLGVCMDYSGVVRVRSCIGVEGWVVVPALVLFGDRGLARIVSARLVTGLRLLGCGRAHCV